MTEKSTKVSEIPSSELTRAIDGVNQLAGLWPQLTPALRKAIVTPYYGAFLQALVLGIKPAHNPEGDYHSLVADELHFSYHRKIGLYDPATVAQVLAATPQYFSHIQLQNGQLVVSKVPTDIEYGLLYGFPLDAVLDFQRYGRTWSKITQLASSGAPGSDNQFMLEYTILDSDERVQYIAVNRNRFNDLFQRYVPGLSQNERDILLQRRGVEVPGFTYVVFRPNQTEGTFPQKVRHIFRASGMDQFIALHRSSSNTSPPSF